MSAAAQSEPTAKAVFYDGVYTLTGRIIRSVLALALSIVLARALGPRGRGDYALATAVYAGFVLSVFGGISAAISYFMLNSAAGRAILRPALVTGGIFTVLGAVPVAAMAQLSHNGWATLPSLILLPCNVPAMIVLGYALGSKNIRWQTSYLVIATGCTLVAMGIAFLFFTPTASNAITAFIAVNILIAAGSLIFVAVHARRLPSQPVSLARFVAFALRVGVVNLVTLLNYRADLYIVALLTVPAVLGQYAVAIALAEGLLVITQVAAVATSPHVGSMARDDAAQLTAQCVRATFGVAAAICAVFFAIAPFAVYVLYGSAYMPMVPALRILLVAVLILSIGSPLSNFFTLKLGRPEVPLISAACAAALCIGVSWVLVPRIGLVGAAAATAAAYALAEGIPLALFVRTAKIRVAALFIPTRSDLDSLARLGVAVVEDLRRKILPS
jgi:O-antigen/teichoic acid export membrane protein